MESGSRIPDQGERRGAQRSIRAKCASGRVQVIVTIDTPWATPRIADSGDALGISDEDLQSEVARITSDVMQTIARSVVLPVPLSEQEVI